MPLQLGAWYIRRWFRHVVIGETYERRQDEASTLIPNKEGGWAGLDQSMF